MTKISAVVITLNEEKNIGRCLDSVRELADELIVVDSGSTDGTREIAESKGARVEHRDWTGYSDQKNYANSIASGTYILSLDADEEVSAALRENLMSIKSELQGAYEFNRLTNYCGHWIRHSGWYPDRKIRLFPKEGSSWEGEFVHEDLILPENCRVKRIKGDIHHYSYYNQKDHKERADQYSTLTAKKLFAEGKRSYFMQPLLSRIGRWFKMYILKRGFQDGWAGKKIAVISARSNAFKYQELKRLEKADEVRSAVKVICLSRTDSIGDVILTLPMAGIIKKEWPECRVLFLGKTYTEPIVEACAYVDEFINFDALKALKDDERTRVIKAENIDAVIHVFPNKRVGKWMKKASVPLRIGTGRRWHHLFSCNKKVWFSRKNSDLHESQLNLNLLKPLYLPWKMALNLIPDHYGFRNFKALGDLQSDKYKLVLHPKSKGSAVEWSLDNYQLLIDSLPSEKVQVYITGTEEEKKLLENLDMSASHVMDLTGKLSLAELVSFIASCDGLVAASTGPLHIASASGIRAVGLYSPKVPIHPGRWAPIGKKATYLVSDEHPSKGALDIDPLKVKAELGF